MGTIGSRRLSVKHTESAPDETVMFAGHGHAEIHRLGEGGVMRAVFEPGWRWSKDMAPTVGTRSCPVSHLGYVVSGHLGIRMDEGTETEIGPGDFFEVAPGHDAWVVGNEPCVVLDFRGYDHYARSVSSGTQRRQQEPEASFRR